MIRKNKITALVTGSVSATILVAACWSQATAATEEISYELDVFPILQSRCVACHAPDGEGYKTSGLDLSSYEGLMKGTKHGPIVVPGEPLTSNLNVLIEGRAQVQMPHNQRPLLKSQQEIIREWVKQGAKDN